MGARVDIKLTGQWAGLEKTLGTGRIAKRLRREVGRATKRNGEIAARAIRKAVRSATAEGAAPLADLTISIKGSRRPLIESWGLHNSITSRQLSWGHGIAGVLRGDASEEHVRRADAMHSTTIIKVTAAMRWMFFALHLVSIGARDPSRLTGRAAELWAKSATKEFYPLAATTTWITLPARPFVKWGTENPETYAKSLHNWRIAIARTFTVKGRTVGKFMY